MIPNAQKHFLEHEILNWAFEAYSNNLHPLSPLADYLRTKKDNFKWLVTVVGVYIMPVYLKDRMKFTSNKKGDLSFICDDPEVRSNTDFLDIVEATFNEGTSPVQRVFVKYLITPLIDNLIIEPTLNIEHPLFKDLKNLPAVYYNHERQTTIAQIIKESTGVEHKGNPDHPLHKASNLIAYYAKQSRVSEAANLPSDYSPLFSKQHNETIAEYMTQEVGKEKGRLKKSKMGKNRSVSSLTTLLLSILKENPSIKNKEVMKKITAYASGDIEEHIGWIDIIDDAGIATIEYETKRGKKKLLRVCKIDQRISESRKTIKNEIIISC